MTRSLPHRPGRRRSRRLPQGLLALPLYLGLLAAPLGCGGSSSPPALVGPPPQPVTIALEEVATGLTSPVFLTHAGDGSGRLFVVLQTGEIRVIAAGGSLVATPFLDLSAVIVALDNVFDERGLLGLAFHPNYATNGRFFVRYSRPRTGTALDPCFGTGRGCHESVLAEFQVMGDPATSNVADPTSEQVLLAVPQPEFNHNSGHIAFGPDGYLYMGLGDGGGAHDGLSQNPPLHGPIGNGQNRATLLGSILRLDVDGTPDVGKAYAVPPSNPFVQTVGAAPEIFAYGLRNPYRFSFDTATGRCFVGDVGQSRLEEVNELRSGANYGWAIREGDTCFDPMAPGTAPATCSDTGPNGERLYEPRLVYGRTLGVSVVMGTVYRGTNLLELQGHLLFGDWASDFGNPNGRLFYCPVEGDHAYTRTDILIDGGGGLGGALNGIGAGEDGELYVLTVSNTTPGTASGTVSRLVAVP